MSADKVIKLGESIGSNSSNSTVAGITLGILTAVLIATIVGIAVIYSSREKETYDKSPLIYTMSVFVLIFACAIYGTVANSVNSKEGELSIKEWKSTAVKPYLASLDKKHLQIDDITFNGDDKVTVLYTQDGEIKHKTGNFKLKRSLDSDKQPYIEYVSLDQDLGHGVNKGWYNVIIYVPSDYKFN